MKDLKKRLALLVFRGVQLPFLPRFSDVLRKTTGFFVN
jgi:hypothetical protein